MSDEEPQLVTLLLPSKEPLQHILIAAVVDVVHDHLGTVGWRLAPEEHQEPFEPHGAAEVELAWRVARLEAGQHLRKGHPGRAIEDEPEGPVVAVIQQEHDALVERPTLDLAPGDEKGSPGGSHPFLRTRSRSQGGQSEGDQRPHSWRLRARVQAVQRANQASSGLTFTTDR